MNRFILSQTSRLLFPYFIMLSLIVLYRGHNMPGGGFIGGLLAACAFILVGLGYDMQQARKKLRVEPVTLMGVGLTIAILSGFVGFYDSDAYMTGAWLPDFYVPLLGKVHLGTPLVFDIGVYLVVIGFVLHTTFSLAELGHAEDEEKEEEEA